MVSNSIVSQMPQNSHQLTVSFCSITGETPQSVRFVKTTMERIGLGVIAVASFSTQVV